jgi:hypothetical protein
VKREKIEALLPLDVQSEIYAEVPSWRVAEPPRRPSITGAMRSNVRPYEEIDEDGIETKMNVRSLEMTSGLN